MNEQKLFPCHNIAYGGRPPGIVSRPGRGAKVQRTHAWERELRVLAERLRTLRRSTGRGAGAFSSLLEARALHVCVEAGLLLDQVRQQHPTRRRGAA